MARPDPFVVVEAGAGTGTLAATILDARPACAGALRYVLVERVARLRAEQLARLPVADPAQVLGPASPPSSRPEDDEDDEGDEVGRDDVGGAAVVGAEADEDAENGEAVAVTVARAGPLVTALAELPAGPLTGVVLANELLDDLPWRLLERGVGKWNEVRVGLGDDGSLIEVVVPAAPDLAAEADRLVPDPPVGARIPLQRAAAAWLRDALALLSRGRVVAIDYASETAELARQPWSSWVRTYRGHGRGGPPLVAPGEQDVTCEVATDQLARVRVPDVDRPQAEFLRAHGIDTLLDEARAAWQARAHIGDLEALRHRSRLSEGAALTDPVGLGGFRVLEWDVGP
jgi:SAM-dependent MidA family methyltransferase